MDLYKATDAESEKAVKENNDLFKEKITNKKSFQSQLLKYSEELLNAMNLRESGEDDQLGPNSIQNILRNIKLTINKNLNEKIESDIFADFDIIDIIFYLLENSIYPNEINECLNILLNIINRCEIDDQLSFLSDHRFPEIAQQLIERDDRDICDYVMRIITEIFNETDETQDFILSIIDFEQLYDKILQIHTIYNQGRTEDESDYHYNSISSYSKLLYKFSRYGLYPNYNNELTKIFRIAGDAFIRFNKACIARGYFLWAQSCIISKDPQYYIPIYNEVVIVNEVCKSVNSFESLERSGAICLIYKGFEFNCDMTDFDFNIAIERFDRSGETDPKVFTLLLSAINEFTINYNKDVNFVIHYLQLLDTLYINDDTCFEFKYIMVLYVMKLFKELKFECQILIDDLEFFKWFIRTDDIDKMELITVSLQTLFHIFQLSEKEGYHNFCAEKFDEAECRDVVDFLSDMISDCDPELSAQIDHFRTYYFAD